MQQANDDHEDLDRQLADQYAGYWCPVNSEPPTDDCELGGEG